MHTANTIQQGVCRNNGNNYTAVPPLATTNYLLTMTHTLIKNGEYITIGRGWSTTMYRDRLTIRVSHIEDRSWNNRRCGEREWGRNKAPLESPASSAIQESIQAMQS